MNIKILPQYLSKQRKQIDQKNLAMIYEFAASAYWLYKVSYDSFFGVYGQEDQFDKYFRKTEVYEKMWDWVECRIETNCILML